MGYSYTGSAAFERLCVETAHTRSIKFQADSAAFERLCVETIWHLALTKNVLFSRLRAAVC